MSLTPIFASPCDFARRMPSLAADFLELETKIGRRFREDSVTDIVIASLLKIGGSNATVFTPPEVKTGSDFDIAIYEPGTKDGVQYRIQSKRLIPNLTNWTWSSYRELDHPHGTGKQSSTIIRSAASEKLPTIPLYAFYNPLSVCDASGDQIEGIQLADARAIRAIVRALVVARANGKRPRWKRLEHLQHLFFPLSTILCPPLNDPLSRALVIRPEVSRKATLEAIEDRRITPTYFDDAPSQLRSELTAILKLAPPEQMAPSIDGPRISPGFRQRRAIPQIIERAIRRTPEEPSIQSAQLKRPKLVLLSRPAIE